MVFIFKNGVKTVFYFLTTSEKHIIISLPDARVSFFDTSLSEKKNEISLPLLKKKNRLLFKSSKSRTNAITYSYSTEWLFGKVSQNRHHNYF